MNDSCECVSEWVNDRIDYIKPFFLVFMCVCVYSTPNVIHIYKRFTTLSQNEPQKSKYIGSNKHNTPTIDDVFQTCVCV